MEERSNEELTFNISTPILAGLSVTMAPAASRALTLSAAAPEKEISWSIEVGVIPCDYAHLFHQL